MTRSDMNQSPIERMTDPASGAAPHRPADDKEEVYFEGSPMIRGEAGKLSLAMLGALLLILSPVVWSVWQGEWPAWWVTLILIALGLMLLMIPVLIVKQIRYRISNYRIDFERGLLGKNIDTLELWHIDDISYHQSFFDRLMGVGTITVVSDDQSTPRLTLRGLPNPRPLFDALKQRVISVKRQRGVIKMDIGS